MLDIFNLSVEDLEKNEKKSSSANEFKPNPKDSKDGVYRALIRPVYWLDNPTKSYIPKTTFYFDANDGNDSGNNFFDSAYSNGEDCPAMNIFFDLKREGKKDARAEQLAKDIKPKSSFFYLVLVESDAVNPDNVGKLMVYKAPIQVHKLIQGAINVSDEDKKIGIKPCNIFDPFRGKSIRLSINIVGGNWNYNGTVSLSDAGPLMYNGQELTVDKKDEFVEFLKTGNELMEPYKFKKLDETRLDLLLSIIQEKTGVGKKKESTKTKSSITIDGIDQFESERTVEQPKVEPKEQPKVETTETAEPVLDDFDDILKGLDV